MKSLIALPILMSLLTGCISLNQSILSDSTHLKEIPHFHTYYISTNDKLPSILANSIESAIKTKMDALGYESSTVLPDLQIHYDIYEDTFTTKYLITHNSENESQFKKEKLKKIKLKHGSIFVSLFNKKDQYVVWRGFTNGHSLNPRIVKSKTYEIMGHYDVFAASEERVAAR